MSVKIRLQRHGKKGRPFYHIVAADARAKRDGRYIERIGSYNPNTNPAVIELDNDAAVKWLQNGAQPTDTARAILSYKGAMLKNHLLKGVQKGALTEDQAEKKFQVWLDDKANRVQGKVEGLEKVAASERATRLAAEKEISDKRATEIAAASATLAAEAAAAAAPVEPVVEAVAEEAPAEAPAEEVAATEEAPAAEEAPAEEAPAAEAAPAEETAVAEEAPADEKTEEEGDKA